MARGWMSFTLGAAVIGGVFLLLGEGARAGDESGAGSAAPAPQAKVDHPLAKAIVGTWDIATKSDWGDATGTVRSALGVGDTALLQDYESVGPMGPFAGHGVWKFSKDGKSLRLWWLDANSAGPMEYAGPLTETGYDLKTKDNLRITLAKTAAGFEFKLYGPDGTLFFTDTYTRK